MRQVSTRRTVRRPLLAVAALCLIAGTLSAAAEAAEPRMWTASGSGTDVIVTDCRDCGDDVGVIISCKGADHAAEVVVPWAAMPKGVEGTLAPVTIQVGRESRSYPARTLRLDAIGYPPAFTIDTHDPLLAALQSGERATIRFGGATATISLRGARAAIDAFRMRCTSNRAAIAGRAEDRGSRSASGHRPRVAGRGGRHLVARPARQRGLVSCRPQPCVGSHQIG